MDKEEFKRICKAYVRNLDGKLLNLSEDGTIAKVEIVEKTSLKRYTRGYNGSIKLSHTIPPKKITKLLKLTKQGFIKEVIIKTEEI